MRSSVGAHSSILWGASSMITMYHVSLFASRQNSLSVRDDIPNILHASDILVRSFF